MNAEPLKVKRSKVGQMPRVVREEINRRLRAGHNYAVIADWANARPDARAVLKLAFHGKPLTPINVGEWQRNGGYPAWLQQQEGEEADLERRVAPALNAAAARDSALAAAVGAPLRVESAICVRGKNSLPILLLTVNGLPAQITVFSTKWLAFGVVYMEGGPPHAATVPSNGKGKPRVRENLTDDPVIVELCCGVLFDFRAGTLPTGPRAIPTPEEARGSLFRVSAATDTIRREGGAER